MGTGIEDKPFFKQDVVTIIVKREIFHQARQAFQLNPLSGLVVIKKQAGAGLSCILDGDVVAIALVPTDELLRILVGLGDGIKQGGFGHIQFGDQGFGLNGRLLRIK